MTTDNVVEVLLEVSNTHVADMETVILHWRSLQSKY